MTNRTPTNLEFWTSGAASSPEYWPRALPVTLLVSLFCLMRLEQISACLSETLRILGSDGHSIMLSVQGHISMRSHYWLNSAGTAALEEDAQILKVIEAYCTSASFQQGNGSSRIPHIACTNEWGLFFAAHRLLGGIKEHQCRSVAGCGKHETQCRAEAQDWTFQIRLFQLLGALFTHRFFWPRETMICKREEVGGDRNEKDF